jgi:flagellin
MRINNNLLAMNTHRQMGVVNTAQSKSMEKLSSGYRINRAGDDAAGLAISEKMRGQIRGLNQASRNSQDAISMIQTAEGALNETQNILQRMRELAVQSANDTNVDADRTSIQNEIDQLATEISRIGDTTEFNTQTLLDGTLSDVKFQIGANQNQDLGLKIGDMRAKSLNVVTSKAELDTAGAAIKSVQADTNFDVTGVTMTAAAGGAIAAKKTGSTVPTKEYAEDISITTSKGVTNSGGFKFSGGGVVIAKADDVNWSGIVTSGASADSGLVISKSGNYITVNIDVITSGDVVVDIDDAITANASGDFVYDNHGVSFTIAKEDFATLADTDVFYVNFNDRVGSGAAKDVQDTITSEATLTTTLSGSTEVKFSGNTITMSGDSAQWLNDASKILISGAGLETSGGTITVKITGAGNEVLSQDTFKLESGAYMSGYGTTSAFEYSNHGISFKITNIGSATDLQLSEDINYIEKSIAAGTGGTDDFNFKITDADGNEQTVAVAWEDNKVYSLSGAVNEINKAASGAGAGAVASLDGDKIVLTAKDTGLSSHIDISQAGILSGLAAGRTSGADESVTLTLKDAGGTAIGSAQQVGGSDTSVTFTDSDNNEITFGLNTYPDLSSVNVSDAYSVGKLNRVDSGIDVSSQSAAAAAITTINSAIESVSAERSKLGAVQNRLEHTIANLDTSAENLQASESRIRDVDMAKEMMEYTKNNILSQAAQSMLAQANQAPQGVLQLLR